MDELRRWQNLQKAIEDILSHHDAPEAVGALYDLKAFVDEKVNRLSAETEFVPWAMVPP